ncbi:disulfide bond formation protein B [Verticiella sediminum]|uniref:Disulfide bond formation protein B n=1 Tax=Verticiella sediminum TaxID=1247510 RepID=A0A556A7I2_9BURK|nr:disulfide bond formation protein B [Verticiella sediminum]TSH88830.1 disulfide bond formation protein B [Verticiella sediminum]
MAEAAVSDRDRGGWAPLFAAWLVALIASLAVLFVGEVMDQTPCNLCWFQRTFMFPLAIVLGVASLRADSAAWRYALPLAVGGLLVAGFHSLLYLGVIPERIMPCSQGVSCTSADMTILGGLPLPLLALAAFGAIATLLLMTRSRTSL